MSHPPEVSGENHRIVEFSLTLSASTSLRSVVDALAPHPAYAVNGRWDVLYANSAAIDLLGAFDAQPGRTDNILRRLFLDEHWRLLFEEWEKVAAAAVAQFRSETAHMIADARWNEFVSALAVESVAFAECWARHDLSEPVARHKILRHPEFGRVRLLYASVAPESEPDDVRVIFYSTESAR
jgi:MmyB-like transcription regulator ligand binding domain